MFTLLWLDFAFSLGKKDPPPPPSPPAWTTGDYIFYGFVFWFALNILRSIADSSGRFQFSKLSKKKKKKNGNGKIKEGEISLSNIIGLKSVKKEIRYYMDFIKNKEKYAEWGVKLPKGIMLIGPPGTGKTLLVKTMAQELDIPIICTSGSAFVEKYVGVGASRIRDLFKKAKTKKKCIIFIDEIDAVGGKRDSETNSERASTLNQLLVEMDGFKDSSGILIFGATNLEKTLDRALLRSGRFDKKVYFDPPNLEERQKIFELYLEDMELPENLSYQLLATRSAGLTGADIANICNQSKINAIQRGQEEAILKETDIQKAIDEVMVGREKRERMMSKKERERVAHHEAGHAVMGFLLQETSPPVKVSIIPRGQFALGFSQPRPEDRKLYTKGYILSQISVLLGGRCAEKLIYQNLSTGAADDIEKVSSLIYQYTTVWGLNKETGPVNVEKMGRIGKNISDELFIECKNIVKKIESYTDQQLKTYKKYVKSIAKKLLDNETITYQEIIEIIPKKLENSIILDNI